MRLRTTKMNKEIDVTALGEVLIDFTFSGVNSEGKKSMKKTLVVLLEIVFVQ